MSAEGGGPGPAGIACVRHFDPWDESDDGQGAGSDTHDKRLPSPRATCDPPLVGDLRTRHSIGNALPVAPGLSSPAATTPDAGLKSTPGGGAGSTFHAENRSLLRRHRLTIGALTAIILFTPVWISLGRALGDPSLGSTTSARVAEWSRDHGAGGLITWVENLYYSHHPPPLGGKPAANAIPARQVHPVAARVSAPPRAVPAPWQSRRRLLHSPPTRWRARAAGCPPAGSSMDCLRCTRLSCGPMPSTPR